MASLDLSNSKRLKKPRSRDKNAPLISADDVPPPSVADVKLDTFAESGTPIEEDAVNTSVTPSSTNTQDSNDQTSGDDATDGKNGSNGSSSNNNSRDKRKKSKSGKKEEKSLIEVARAMSSEAKKVSFNRLLQQSRREGKILCIGFVFTLFNSLITLCTPIIMGAIISSISVDDVKQSDLSGPVKIVCSVSPVSCDNNKDLLYTSVLTLFFLAFFGAFFAFAKWTALEIAGERVVARLRKILFHRILCQEVGLFDTTKTGELVNRLSTDTTVLKSACTTQVAQSLSSLTGIILSVFYVFYLSWRLTCVMLGIIPIIVIAGKLYGSYYRKQSKLNQDYLAEATQVASESIGLIRTVKSFSKEDFEEMRYCQAIDSTYKQGVKMAVANGGFMAFFTIVSNVGIGSVLWYGATLTFDGTLNTGSLTTYVILTIQIGFQFSSLINLYTNVMKALGATERVFQLIDRVPQISSKLDANLSNSSNSSNNLKNSKKDEYEAKIGITNDLDVNGAQRKRIEAMKKLEIGESGREGWIGEKAIEGHVEIREVTFGYPSRPQVKVLKDLSLDVSPGRITALVGESGGGKSTVAKLVMRFYDPDAGQITIDGRCLKNFDLRWLHQQIGFVSQEPVLFGATIRDNILYGVRQNYYHIAEHINDFDAFGRNKKKKTDENGFNNKYNRLGSDAEALEQERKENNMMMIDVADGNEGIMGRNVTEEDIINAAKQANAHGFIMGFPDGYDTLVGERGIRLSGGQKQRVAIARAILMDPKILLLDEATSALDSESEYLVQQALDRIMVGRSVLVIAHRLSTVKSADTVCVIEKGRVVEAGTHQELIENENGSYAKLVRRQLFAH